MKHLLTGVAMAAALAIAAPVWAQNAPSSPSAPPAAPAAPAAKAPASSAAKPMAGNPAAKPMAMKKPMHHMAMHHHMWMHHRAMGQGDQMTEQLNSQELQRITGGGPGGSAGSMTPGGNNPTSGSAGPFAPAGSAPPPPAMR
jgi:hypothetical protein